MPALLRHAYAEIEGAAEAAPLEAFAVFGGMMTMNGGAPVACRA
jgi:hypothetical protein